MNGEVCPWWEELGDGCAEAFEDTGSSWTCAHNRDMGAGVEWETSPEKCGHRDIQFIHDEDTLNNDVGRNVFAAKE